MFSNQNLPPLEIWRGVGSGSIQKIPWQGENGVTSYGVIWQLPQLCKWLIWLVFHEMTVSNYKLNLICGREERKNHRGICLELVGQLGKEDWEGDDWEDMIRGKWLERKWVWDNWYFLLSQKTQRWERGTSFPRSHQSWFFSLNKAQKDASLHCLPPLSAHSMAVIRRAEHMSSAWQITGRRVALCSFLFLCFDCLSFFFSFKRKRAKNPANLKTRILWNSSFLSTPVTRLLSLFYKASRAL